MIFQRPKAYTAVQKKYPSTPAIELDNKIVQVGNFSNKKEYETIMQRLMKKYPKSKEEDFVFSFIYGKRPYIV